MRQLEMFHYCSDVVSASPDVYQMFITIPSLSTLLKRPSAYMPPQKCNNWQKKTAPQVDSWKGNSTDVRRLHWRVLC